MTGSQKPYDAITVKDGQLVIDNQLRYQREFLDSLASFGPNAYTTALALQNWARQVARDNKDQLRWTRPTPPARSLSA